MFNMCMTLVEHRYHRDQHENWNAQDTNTISNLTFLGMGEEINEQKTSSFFDRRPNHEENKPLVLKPRAQMESVRQIKVQALMLVRA